MLTSGSSSSSAVQRVWECASRKTRGKGGVDGPSLPSASSPRRLSLTPSCSSYRPDDAAVAVFAILHAPGQPKKTVIIEQYRPPVGSVVIELPAGLIDEGEEPGCVWPALLPRPPSRCEHRRLTGQGSGARTGRPPSGSCGRRQDMEVRARVQAQRRSATFRPCQSMTQARPLVRPSRLALRPADQLVARLLIGVQA